MRLDGMLGQKPITFQTLTIRVPGSGVVRVPDGGYPHEFASMPNGWREIAFNPEVQPRWIKVPFVIRQPLYWEPADRRAASRNVAFHDGAGTRPPRCRPASQGVTTDDSRSRPVSL